MSYLELRDEELMERLFYKDLKAFETIYDRYCNMVYSTALRIVNDNGLAEDLTQEIFLRIWRQPELYVAERGRFMSWLISVSRNRAVDEIRKRGRRQRLEFTVADEQNRAPAGDADDPLRMAQLSDERVRVQRALKGLPAEQRQALELAYFHGLTQREIAAVLGQPLGTVKTRIRLGMQKLRMQLKEQAGGQLSR
ncbi:MAG TPA: sigma-70 family RNA polymerase sigma factor [Dehalococcoidia bacterium]|nr:sigma-70 family RNA polymerase sigma factor [Dehalococcoidia bacterium]